MKPVAILGSGPAGLMAVHAVTMTDKPYALFSKPVKSRIGGAQFLHRYIPGLTPEAPEAMITYEMLGTEAEYRSKVYGRFPVPFTSWQHIQDGMTQEAWSLPALYDAMWDLWSPTINDVEVTPQWLDDHVDQFECVISAIPRHAICRSAHGLVPQPHSFTSQPIKIKPTNMLPLRNNTILYNGSQSYSWYRCSNLFGTGSTEWGADMMPPLQDLVTVRKPIHTTCNCYEDVVRVGRYGRWEKGVLSHDGFFSTLVNLRERGL